jgi:exopolysaccharide biosynthesis polyprenyl glycosylphosphotransferase
MQAIKEAVADDNWFSRTSKPEIGLTRGLAAVLGPFWSIMDIVGLSLALMLLVVAPYFAQNALRFSDFLALRISMKNLLVVLICWAAWRAILWASGLYSAKSFGSLRGLVRQTAIASGCCSVVAAIVVLARHRGENTWVFLASFWVLSFAFMLLGRAIAILHHAFIRPRFRKEKNLIVVGSGPRAQQVYIELQSHPESNYVLLGFVDSDPRDTLAVSNRILGGLDQLEEILMRQVVDEVVITLPMKSMYAEIERAIYTCERVGVQSQYSMDVFKTSVTKRCYTDHREPNRVILEMVHNDHRRHLKRAIDLVASFIGLALLAPLFLVVAIAIKLTSNGPIVFKQERYGLNKRKFHMYKFRSMVVDAEARQAQLEHLNETAGPTFKIKKDPRVTKIGAFIRRSSIDELPQLLNVLKGDMSLVGPRPLPTRDVTRFSEAWLMRRFSVKPGLTCLWQITGRSDTTFDRWMELDLTYIDQWSLSLDMKILAMTFPAVLKGKGAA